MNTTQQITALKGGEWIIKESNASDTFIPEDFNEEQRMVLDMCHQFLQNEILPIVDRIDQLEPGLMPLLLEKAGEQGLLSTSFPEDLGGLGKDFITSTIVNEGLGGGHSFSVAVAAHTGIGTLPILYFGTTQQQQKYIPKLASGQWKGAYGLTEPNSGSDALSAKTTAILSDDGKYYLLNGQKCWITNGGFAHVYTVFAKVDGDKFTAFIVERGTPGFTQGPEEKKMGIKGSSTVQLYFQDCKVPVENVLGELLTEIPIGGIWRINIEFRLNEKIKDFIIAVGISDIHEYPICTTWSTPLDLEAGNYRAFFTEENLKFNPGRYKLIIGISEGTNSIDYIDNEVTITFSDVIEFQSESIVNYKSGFLNNQMAILINKEGI